MRMIPSVVSEFTRSAAERRVFGLLHSTTLRRGSCCLHSLELSQHDYKICGELDFVIVGDGYVLVLEVKGGGVANRDGVWLFTDRFGIEHRKSEGPFHQARSGMFSLRGRLEDHFGPEAIRRLTFGYGVVFPDCDFDVSSVEWERPMVVDASALRETTDLSSPLDDLLAYWESKQPSSTGMPVGFTDRLIQFLRPSFERVPSLRIRADALDVSMEALTREQYDRLDIIHANARILCSGGAGTGKTFLALEVARRHAARGERVLLVCAGVALAAFLRSRVKSDRIVVQSVDAGLPVEGRFNVLIVDEGQDVINLQTLDRLDRLLAGGLAQGTWRFFFDANSQAGLTGRFEPDALDLLRSWEAVSANLAHNCRNTNEIVIQTKLVTGSDIGTPSAGTGPPVKYEFYDSPARQAVMIDDYLKELSSGQVPLGDITILSPLPLDQSCVPLTKAFRKGQIRSLSAELTPQLPLTDLTFSSVVDFKGLENRFVLLVDLENTAEYDYLRRVLYVGMTRARTGLWIAAKEDLRGAIASLASKNLNAVLPDIELNSARSL